MAINEFPLGQTTSVKVASIVNLAALTGTGQTLDTSYVVQNGDKVLLQNQTNPLESGVWIARDLSRPWIRDPTLSERAQLTPGTTVYIENGTAHAGLSAVLTNQAIGGTIAQVWAIQDAGPVNAAAIALNTTHAASDGTDHADVVTNTAAIALNTTHSGGDGSDHANVATNTAGLLLPITLRNPGSVLYREDFFGTSGATLPTPWATNDFSAVGAPTLDYEDSDGHFGTYKLACDVTNEVQRLTLNWGGRMHFGFPGDGVGVNCGAIVEWVYQWDGPSHASTTFVVGLASDLNADLDAITQSLWIRVTGNNLDLLVEADDDSTDYSADSGVNILTGNRYIVRFDLRDVSNVSVSHGTVEGGLSGWAQIDSGIDMSGNDLYLQPYAEVQKNSADACALILDAFSIYIPDRVRY